MEHNDEVYRAPSESDGHLVFGRTPEKVYAPSPCPQCFRGFSTVCHIGHLGQTIDLVHEVHSLFKPWSADRSSLFAPEGRAGAMMRSRGMCSASGLSSKFTRIASELAETRRNRSGVRRLFAALAALPVATLSKGHPKT